MISRTILVGIAALTLVQTAGAGVGEPASPSLYLRSGTVDISALPNLLSDPDALFDPARHYLLQLDGPITAERRAAVAGMGVELGAYLPLHAYLVDSSEVPPAGLAALGFVRWVGEFRNEWKLDPNIGSRPFKTPARLRMQTEGKLDLIVNLFSDADTAATIQTLSERGMDVRTTHRIGRHDAVRLIVSADRLPELKEIEAVQFVEESPELTARNDTNEWIVQSNVTGETPAWDRGIRGEGQIGGLIDWPVNIDHCSFEDDVEPGPDHRKVVAYRGAMGSDTHGTHVCGSFVGDSGTWGSPDFRDGIALAAKVSYSSAPDIYDDPESFIDRLNDAHADGARVHSNSWGDDGTTDYTTWCEQIDRFSHDNEESLVAFAVTNLTTLKTPENAKNVLAVGATSDTPNQHNHCKGGSGPTSDGRRKPEIFAPGCGTQSSYQATECGWLSYTGTSMAVPVISGSGLLVRQYFVDGFYPSGLATTGDELTPSGALIKAMLINAAVDMTGVTGYPTDKEGWGRLLLDGSLYFEGDVRTLFVVDVRNADGLSTDDTLSNSIEVTDSAEPLRITLAWTDVPATIGADYAPVNDLDLTVQGPDGAIYLGNDFKNGQSEPDVNVDAVNNLEQVHRITPLTGTYTITVTATEVNEETQGFALVATGALKPVALSCPGDANSDGTIDPLDAGYVLSRFGCSVGTGDPLCDAADQNADGFVDPLDVGFVLSRFGLCP